MDNCFEDNKRYFWQFENENKASFLNGSINLKPNRGFLKNKQVDEHCVDYNLYWQHFKEVNEEFCHGRIINCSVNGILDVFPKVEIQNVLAKFGDRYAL
jgi:hypothetical protein